MSTYEDDFDFFSPEALSEDIGNVDENYPSSFDREMQQTEERPSFNDEMFLRHVSNYPALFDSQQKGYSNKLKKLRGWENVARSMDTTVEFCLKRWKSLREKYKREKQKLNNSFRSGAAAETITTWPLMSYFDFMFDHAKPRETVSSRLLVPADVHHNDDLPNTSHLISSQDISSHNAPYISNPTTSSIAKNRIQDGSKNNEPNCNLSSSCIAKSKGTKRPLTLNKPLAEKDAFVGILGNISNTIQTISERRSNSDKISGFGNYVCAELRDLPTHEQEEFMDCTIIKLLQMKRKYKKNKT